MYTVLISYTCIHRNTTACEHVLIRSPTYKLIQTLTNKPDVLYEAKLFRSLQSVVIGLSNYPIYSRTYLR